ncbi:MAG: hypothetical protein FD143_1186 [Ignavibacteria bacterium]|nr:MAG: hypothetical protein FD143_1186 [Ignavibacteria bacterium]KAF0160696.1 MAG: hypothetical protein FD188_1472 [Ignavibacteria bacterium]
MNRTRIKHIRRFVIEAWFKQIQWDLIAAHIRLPVFFFLILLAASFFSCYSSFSSIYGFDYPLTKSFAKSNSGKLNVQIPQGWFVAEDNENNTVDLWLVKEDYSATIKFIAVSLDEETTKSFSDNELIKVVELNKVLIKSKLRKSFKGFTNEELFGNSSVFSAYQYVDEKNQQVRTVVFKLGSQFYESTAFAIKSFNPAEIFKTQNSVLASIK